MRHVVGAGVVVILSWSSCLTAAEPVSGPKVGEKAGGFEVLAATGDRAGKTLDYLAALDKKPVLLIFVRDKDKTRPAYGFLRVLDQYGQLRQPEGLEVLIVRVAADQEAAVKYSQLLNEKLNIKSTAVVSTAGASGPQEYALNEDAEMTVLLLDKEHKVVSNTARRAPERQDFAEVRTAIDKLLGPSPVPFDG